jgi:uncharacterized protein (TIGR02300 family)
LRHLGRVAISAAPRARRRGGRGVRRDCAAPIRRLGAAESGADALLTGRARAAKGSTAQQAEGLRIVAKPELGTKRLCANCGAKFYDLSKDPIVCPKCATVFVPPVASRARPEPVAPVVAPAPVEEEVAVPETSDAELISLEDAEKETEGTKAPAAEGADAEVDDEPLDDAAFIVPEEEDEDDVTDIIGEGIENDEET